MKTCLDCKETKPINEFYTHKKMADGHLNKCKNCVKKRLHNYWHDGRGKIVDKRRNLKPKRIEWKRQQSARMRIKHRAKIDVNYLWYKHVRQNKIIYGCCSVCGTNNKIEAHHSDYNKPYDIIWFCSLRHKEWHRNNKPILPIPF